MSCLGKVWTVGGGGWRETGSLILGLFPLEEYLGVKAPPKVAFFLWTVVWGKIFKWDNLMHWGYALVRWCCMCCGSGKRWITFCYIVLGQWCCGTMFFVLLGFSVCSRVGWWIFCLIGGTGSKKHSLDIWNLAPSCLMWTVWREQSSYFRGYGGLW